MAQDLRLVLELKAKVDQFTSAVQAASSSLGKAMTDMAGSAERTGNEVEQAFEKIGIERHSEIAAEIEDVKKAYDTLGESGKVSGAELAQANVKSTESIEGIRQKTVGWSESLRGMKAELLGAVATLGTLGYAIGSAAGKAAEFDQAMREVSTLLDDTSSMDQLTESVRGLSQEFGSSNVEQAKALYQIISAGATDAATATDILTASNKLAIGGVTDTKTAADGLTTVLNAYKGAAGDATAVSDAMFVAMKAGKTTIGELSASLGQVAPLASQAGVGFEELLAAASTLTKSGLKTSEAMTAIRGAISAAIKPTSEAVEMAKSLGLEFDAAALKTKGFAGFLADVAQKSGGSTEKLGKLFGSVEGLNGVLALTGKGAQDFGAILGAMGNKAGETERAFAKMADSPEMAAKKFKAALGDLQTSFGQAATALTPLLNGLTSALALFNEMPAVSKGVVLGVGAIGTTAVGVLPALLKLKDAMVLFSAASTATQATAQGTTAALVATSSAASVASAGIGAAAVSIGAYAASAAVVGVALAATVHAWLLNSDATKQAEQATMAASKAHQELVTNLYRAAGAYKDFRDTVILTAEKVAELNGEERQRYRDSIDGLKSYLEWLQKANAAEIKAYGATPERIKQQEAIKEALANVTKGLKEYDAGLDLLVAKLNGWVTPAMIKAQKAIEAAQKSLGIDLREALSGVSAAALKAADDFAAVAQNIKDAGIQGKQAATVLEKDFQTALKKATNPKDVELLIDTLKELASEGTISGQQLAAGLKVAEDRLKELGKAGKDAAEKIGDAWEQYKKLVEAGYQAEVERAKQINATTAALVKSLDEQGNSFDQFQKRGTAAWEALQLGASKTAEKTTGAARIMTVETARQLDSIAALGEEAKAYFDTHLKAAFTGAIADAATFSGTMASLAQKTHQLFGEGVQDISRITTALQGQEGATYANVRAAEQALSIYAELGEERLQPLRAALADALARTQQLDDQARSTLENLQNEFDQLDKNQKRVEERQYQRKKEDLQAQLDAARQAGAAQASKDLSESLTVLDQIHRKKLADIAAEAAAARAAEKERRAEAVKAAAARELSNLPAPLTAAEREALSLSRAPAGAPVPTAKETAPATAPVRAAARTVRIEFGGAGGPAGLFDETSAEALLAMLERQGLRSLPM